MHIAGAGGRVFSRFLNGTQVYKWVEIVGECSYDGGKAQSWMRVNKIRMCEWKAKEGGSRDWMLRS
jgi:hypothetical protein